ncbi:ABC transporter ATP-binding protein/permease [Gammaproteobacteria bacterium]|nr:ABC transporter ATP-binding protein/permease [Gammaproteobacteria bacterium]
MLNDIRELYRLFRQAKFISSLNSLIIFSLIPLAALMEVFTIAVVGISVGWLINGSPSSEVILLVTQHLEIVSGLEQKLVFMMVSIICLNFFTQLFTWFFINRITATAGTSISASLLGAYINPNGSAHDQPDLEKVYTLLIVESQRIAIGIVNPLITMLSKLTFLVILVIGFFVLDPVLAFWGTLSIFILYLLIFTSLRAILYRLSNQMSHYQMVRSSQIARLFGNLNAYKIYGNYASEFKHFIDKTSTYFKSLVLVNFTAGAPRFLVEFLLFIFVSAILYMKIIGAVSITPQLFASFSIYVVAMLKIIPAAQTLYASIGVLQGNSSALRSWLEEYKNYRANTASEFIIEHKAEPVLNQFSDNVRLKLTDYKSSDSSKTILHSIDISLNKGGRYGFVGPSGSGKTSLVEIFASLRHNFNGDLYIDGVAVSIKESSKLRGLVSYVDQRNSIFSGTLLENITYGFISKVSVDIDRLNYAIEVAQIEDVVSGLDNGLNTHLSDAGAGLSGGQRQRIALARAIYKKSNILILDEVTSALDEESENRVISAIANMPSDLTILIVSHRPKPLKLVDTVFEFKDGTIVNVQMSPDALK